MSIWLRDATVVRVHDGDTVICDINLGNHAHRRKLLLDLGWHVRASPDGKLLLRQAVRVDGLAAPELVTPEGRAAAVYAVKLLPEGAPVEIISKKLLGSFEKYGRILADLNFGPVQTNRSYAAAMIRAGHGKPWDGSGKQPT